MNEETLFTPAALLDFLCQIDELADYAITVDENDSTVKVTIGESVYTINKNEAEPVEVEPEAVDEVSEINDATYEEIDNTDYEQFADIPEDAPIEAGIISEILKTLAVGGMVRLTGKVLGDDLKK